MIIHCEYCNEPFDCEGLKECPLCHCRFDLVGEDIVFENICKNCLIHNSNCICPEFRLIIQNSGCWCEYCGYSILVAIIEKDNKFFWESEGYDYDQIEEFRKEVQAKLDELGITRDLSSNCCWDWEDE